MATSGLSATGVFVVLLCCLTSAENNLRLREAFQKQKILECTTDRNLIKLYQDCVSKKPQELIDYEEAMAKAINANAASTQETLRRLFCDRDSHLMQKYIDYHRMKYKKKATVNGTDTEMLSDNEAIRKIKKGRLPFYDCISKIEIRIIQ